MWVSVFEQVEAFVDVVLQHLGIYLRGGDVGVGKHSANGLDAHTTRQGVGGKSVSPAVHGDVLVYAGKCRYACAVVGAVEIIVDNRQ